MVFFEPMSNSVDKKYAYIHIIISDSGIIFINEFSIITSDMVVALQPASHRK